MYDARSEASALSREYKDGEEVNESLGRDGGVDTERVVSGQLSSVESIVEGAGKAEWKEGEDAKETTGPDVNAFSRAPVPARVAALCSSCPPTTASTCSWDVVVALGRKFVIDKWRLILLNSPSDGLEDSTRSDMIAGGGESVEPFGVVSCAANFPHAPPLPRYRQLAPRSISDIEAAGIGPLTWIAGTVTAGGNGPPPGGCTRSIFAFEREIQPSSRELKVRLSCLRIFFLYPALRPPSFGFPACMGRVSMS